MERESERERWADARAWGTHGTQLHGDNEISVMDERLEVLHNVGVAQPSRKVRLSYHVRCGVPLGNLWPSTAHQAIAHRPVSLQARGGVVAGKTHLENA